MLGGDLPAVAGGGVEGRGGQCCIGYFSLEVTVNGEGKVAGARGLGTNVFTDIRIGGFSMFLTRCSAHSAKRNPRTLRS